MNKPASPSDKNQRRELNEFNKKIPTRAGKKYVTKMFSLSAREHTEYNISTIRKIHL